MLNTLAGETQAKLLHLLRRAPRTITELSVELGLTDNAIRTHIAALTRDGLVQLVGTQRDTGGKPARQYGLTIFGGELFPKAYAMALGGLVDEIVRVEGQARAVELLKGVGVRAARGAAPASDLAGRVAAAAATLRELGADIDVVTEANGWGLKGYGCPLSAVTAGHPEVCALVAALVAEMTGRPVEERCDRSAQPRCCFHINTAEA